MVVALDGDTIEQARSYAEDERRRQQAEQARSLEDTIRAQLANPDRNPEVVVDPNSHTGWSFRGAPVKDWTGAPVGNASVDALAAPPPPLADNGYGFEGQNWYAQAPEPTYTPVPNFTAVPPPPSPFAGAGFGADVGIGADRVQTEIDQRRALGERFLPPSSEQAGRSNWLERAIGPVGDALREGFSTIDVGLAETGLDLVRPAVGAGGFGLARRDNREVVNDSIGSIAENARGGNPWDFLNRQEADFNQRPIQEQLVGEAFKPSNWVGTGAVTKILTGAGKGGSTAAKGARAGAAVNRALDVGQAKIAAPAIGAIGGYVANEAAGQPLEPWQAALGGGVAGLAAPTVFKGAKALGGELTTGRLAGETGAIDFRRLDQVIDTRTGLPAKIMTNPPVNATEASTVRVKLEGKPGTEVRPLGELQRPMDKARETLAASDAAIQQADASIRAAGGNPPPIPERLQPASGVTPPPRASDTAYQSHDEWRRGRDAFVKSEIARRAEVAGETVYHASPFEYTGLEARWAELHPEPYVRTKAYHEAHGLPWPPSDAIPNRQVAGSIPAGATTPELPAPGASGVTPPPRVPTATGATPTPPSPPVDTGSLAGGIGREAARVFGHAAVGSGIGASVGAYTSGGDREAILKGALIGAGSGVAFRGVGAAAGKVAGRGMAERIAAREVAMGVPKAPESVSKLATIIRAAKPVRAETETMKSQALAQKAARLHGVYGATSGEAAVRAAPGALTGELPKAAFEAPRPSFAQTEIDSLFDHVVANPKVAGPNQRNIFNVFNTQNALTKVLAGELPTNGEIKLLETAFGEDLAKALLSKRSLGAKAWSVAMDAVNLPRTLVTSIDASAPLRQGAILAAGHPLRSLQSVGTMVRAMASPEFTKYVDEGIELSPNAPLYERMKLYFAPSSMAGDVSGREEAFMSKLATKIPGVGGSQRGYTTYLNAVRQRVADDWLRTLSPEQKANDDVLQQMGNWLNVASGRGKLPPVGDRVLSISSGVLFAPRYAVSRIQVPWELLKAVNPTSGMAMTVRKEIARDLVTFVGTGVAILELGKQSGWWDAETDPRSTDFGKIRMGATRWDMWAGEQQIARTIAQIATRQRKSTSSGEIMPTDRSDTLLRWFRSKASPAAGLAWDVAEGKTFIGEEINADKATLTNQAFQRFMPLFIQDVTEAWMEDGFKAAARSVPSGFGMGVQTYLSTRDIQNRVSQEKYGKVYLDLTKGERDTVKADPRVAEEFAKFNEAVDVNPSQFFDRKSEFNTNLEADLRGKLDQGLNDPTLRAAVSDLKGNRWTASEALLGGDAVQKALKSGVPLTQIADTLAEAYWSAPVKETVTTDGYIDLDFDSRDASRADVLSKAREAGVDPNYITGTGLGTFRGERFSDPKVKEAVEKVEAVQKRIEDSGWWELKDKAFQEAVSNGWVKGDVQPQPGQGFYDWQEAVIAKYLPAFVDKYGPEIGPARARQEVSSYKPLKDFSDWYNEKQKPTWVMNNVEAAKLLIKWGYVDTFGKDGDAWLAKQ